MDEAADCDLPVRLFHSIYISRNREEFGGRSDMKKAVDPNFLLSPNKFHMHSYNDDISKYIINNKE